MLFYQATTGGWAGVGGKCFFFVIPIPVVLCIPDTGLVGKRLFNMQSLFLASALDKHT